MVDAHVAFVVEYMSNTLIGAGMQPVPTATKLAYTYSCTETAELETSVVIGYVLAAVDGKRF